MLKDFRCGQCWKLQARMGDPTELHQAFPMWNAEPCEGREP